MTPRATTFALIGSAALNLFLVGALAGVMAMGLRLGSARPAPHNPLRGAAASLEAQDRSKLVSTLRAQGLVARPLKAQAHELRRDAWATLSDASFDSARVKAGLAQARALDQRARGGVEDSVVDFAGALPLEERKAFGLAMQRALASTGRPGGSPRRLAWRGD